MLKKSKKRSDSQEIVQLINTNIMKLKRPPYLTSENKLFLMVIAVYTVVIKAIKTTMAVNKKRNKCTILN